MIKIWFSVLTEFTSFKVFQLMNENLWFSFETIIAFSNIYMIMFLKVDWEKLNNYLAKKKIGLW